MVTPSAYPVSSELGRGRYSSRTIPYAGYPAYTTATDRRYQLPSHDSRHQSTMTERVDHDSDAGSSNRKRIAVACGRCRKRKIRCSGDPGDGTPCSNCKSAGHEPCLFLRVSSTETPFRDNDFGYNIDAARTYHTRVSPLSVTPYGTPELSVGADMFGQSYRTGGNYSYSMPTTSPAVARGYYPGMSSWNGSTSSYGEDATNMDYSAASYPMAYQALASGALGNMSGYGRSYTNVTDGSSSSSRPTYVEPDAPAYTYQPASAASSYNMPLAQPQQHVHSRHSADAPTTAPTDISLQSMAANLPTSSAASSSGRLLSEANRTLSSSTPYSHQQQNQHRVDGLPSLSYANKSDPLSSINSNFETFATVVANTQSLSTATENPMFGAESSSATAIRPPTDESYVYTTSQCDRGNNNSRSTDLFQRRSTTTTAASTDTTQPTLANSGTGMLSNGALYYPAETPSTSSSSPSHNNQGSHYHQSSQTGLDSLSYVVTSNQHQQPPTQFSHHTSTATTSAATTAATITSLNPTAGEAGDLRQGDGGPDYLSLNNIHVNLVHSTQTKLLPSCSSPTTSTIYKPNQDVLLTEGTMAAAIFPPPATTTAATTVVGSPSYSPRSSSSSSSPSSPSSPSSFAPPSPSSAGGGGGGSGSLYAPEQEDEEESEGEEEELGDGDYVEEDDDEQEEEEGDGEKGIATFSSGEGAMKMRGKTGDKRKEKIAKGKENNRGRNGRESKATLSSFSNSSVDSSLTTGAAAVVGRGFDGDKGATATATGDDDNSTVKSGTCSTRAVGAVVGKTEANSGKEKTHSGLAQRHRHHDSFEQQREQEQRIHRNRLYYQKQRIFQPQYQSQHHESQYHQPYQQHHHHLGGSSGPTSGVDGRRRAMTAAGN